MNTVALRQTGCGAACFGDVDGEDVARARGFAVGRASPAPPSATPALSTRATSRVAVVGSPDWYCSGRRGRRPQRRREPKLPIAARIRTAECESTRGTCFGDIDLGVSHRSRQRTVSVAPPNLVALSTAETHWTTQDSSDHPASPSTAAQPIDPDLARVIASWLTLDEAMHAKRSGARIE
jgi:hypothetical protein